MEPESTPVPQTNIETSTRISSEEEEIVEGEEKRTGGRAVEASPTLIQQEQGRAPLRERKTKQATDEMRHPPVLLAVRFEAAGVVES